MVEKMNGVKYWVLIGSAVILSACANTGVVPEIAPEPVVTEPVTEAPVIAEPPAPVEAEMLEPGSQESLDADAGNGLVYFAYDCMTSPQAHVLLFKVRQNGYRQTASSK